MTIYSTESMNLVTVRMNYEKAVSDKKLCQKKIEALRTDIDCTVVPGLYLGSFQNLWLNESNNPISKLQTLKKAK